MRSNTARTRKLRGIPRRLRALARWSEGFEGYFPAGLSEPELFFRYKIPVPCSLVEGKQATRAIRRECAQRLIDACAHLIKARPQEFSSFRVVVTLCLPDMFASEVCIYTNEAFFQDYINLLPGEYGVAQRQTRSLATEWGLLLPEGLQEIGYAIAHLPPEREDRFIGERWYFGEIE